MGRLGQVTYLGGYSALALPGRPDGHVADFDVIGLLDGERDGARHGLWADAECRHVMLGPLSLRGVVDVVDELGADWSVTSETAGLGQPRRCRFARVPRVPGLSSSLSRTSAGCPPSVRRLLEAGRRRQPLAAQAQGELLPGGGAEL